MTSFSYAFPELVLAACVLRCAVRKAHLRSGPHDCGGPRTIGPGASILSRLAFAGQQQTQSGSASTSVSLATATASAGTLETVWKASRWGGFKYSTIFK